MKRFLKNFASVVVFAVIYFKRVFDLAGVPGDAETWGEWIAKVRPMITHDVIGWAWLVLGVMAIIAIDLPWRSVWHWMHGQPIREGWPGIEGMKAAELQEATDLELQSATIKNRSVRVGRLPLDGAKISGRTFENCMILGPAIIFGLDGTVFEQCRFGYEGKIETILWTVRKDRFIVGVVGFERCLFRMCDFKMVGFCGTKEQIAHFKSQVTRPPGSSPTSK